MLSKPIRQYASQSREYLRAGIKPNFYRLHLCYFIATILISSAILYGANTADFHVRYIDALFLCCSAMCNAGLNTINLGSINAFQQSVLLVTMLMGDLTLATISVVVVRRHFFAKYMKEFLQHSRTGQMIADDIENHNSRTQTSSRNNGSTIPR